MQHPLWQLVEEIDPAARTRYQVVEVLHFRGGEIIPRRVLCPWRAHLLASTLPAVARATAACFVWCEWMIGRGLGLLRHHSLITYAPSYYTKRHVSTFSPSSCIIAREIDSFSILARS